jgi:ribosomal protein S18 acetylase RimI-like enzyme
VTAVLNGVIGPRGDGYVVGATMSPSEAAAYHALQARAFAEAAVDMISATTMTYAEEAIGVTRAAAAVNVPVVVSLTVETDGRLPSGQAIGDAIAQVDAATDGAPAYFVLNCAHPTHFLARLDAAAGWTALTIEPHTPAHTDRVVELSLHAWAPVFASFKAVMGERLYERVHPDWRRDQAESVRAALRANATWVAVVDGEVVGFVNVAFDDAERSAEIYMIAVYPRPQRRGVGSALTDFALAEMRARGVTLAVVATGGDPGHAPARATYERAGFTGVAQVWYAKRLA